MVVMMMVPATATATTFPGWCRLPMHARRISCCRTEANGPSRKSEARHGDTEASDSDCHLRLSFLGRQTRRPNKDDISQLAVRIQGSSQIVAAESRWCLGIASAFCLLLPFSGIELPAWREYAK
jgi:hypothetical protein